MNRTPQTVVLTDAILEELRSPQGGWKRAVLEPLGVPWPLPKGWRRRLLGTPVGADRLARARSFVCRETFVTLF